MRIHCHMDIQHMSRRSCFDITVLKTAVTILSEQLNNGLIANLGVIVFPGFVLLFQSFDWIHELRSSCRHFESRRAWIRNISGQSFHTNKENNMAASFLSSFCARSLFILPSQKLRCFCTQGDSHTIHVPVMLKECLSFLAPRDGQVSH